METDIMGSVQMGYHSVLVLSGGTRQEQLDDFAFTPDLILKSVAELADPGCDLWALFGSRNTDEDSVPDIDQWRELQYAKE